jgi:hypothetical protein
MGEAEELTRIDGDCAGLLVGVRLGNNLLERLTFGR